MTAFAYGTTYFSAAAAKSPEMGVAAMAVSMVIVPIVSALTKNKDTERVGEIFTCYNEDYYRKYTKQGNVEKVETARRNVRSSQFAIRK